MNSILLKDAPVDWFSEKGMIKRLETDINHS